MIVKILRKYLYFFLILDLATGYFVNTRVGGGFLTPGILVKTIIIFFLFIYYLTVSKRQISATYFIYFSFFVIINNLLFFNMHIIQEINFALKMVYAGLFLNYAINDYEYLKDKLNKIMIFNFILVLFVLMLAYLFGVGFSTYTLSGQEYGIKGFFDGGNTLSVMLLLFFAYFLYKNNKLFLILAIFLMLLIKTKVIFLSILGVGVKYYYLAINKKNKIAIAAGFVFILVVFTNYNFLIKVLSSLIGTSDFSIILERQKYIFGYGTSILDTLYYSRRIFDSITQLSYQFQSDILKVLFGFGRGGQMVFWSATNWQNTQFSGMDQFDLLFRYGVVGLMFFIKYYFVPLFSYYKAHKLNITIAVLVLIYGYSFFGGYVIVSTPLMTFVALFLNEVYVDNRKRKSVKFFKKNKELIFSSNEISNTI